MRVPNIIFTFPSLLKVSYCLRPATILASIHTQPHEHLRLLALFLPFSRSATVCLQLLSLRAFIHDHLRLLALFLPSSRSATACLQFSPLRAFIDNRTTPLDYWYFSFPSQGSLLFRTTRTPWIIGTFPFTLKVILSRWLLDSIIELT